MDWPIPDRIATLGSAWHGARRGTCHVSIARSNAFGVPEISRKNLSGFSTFSGPKPTMRAVDLQVAVFMCGTHLGALLSSAATAVVKSTYKTPSGGLIKQMYISCSSNLHGSC